MTNQELYDTALEAVKELFSDTSISVEDCKINMNTLISEIEAMVSGLPQD